MTAAHEQQHLAFVTLATEQAESFLASYRKLGCRSDLVYAVRWAGCARHNLEQVESSWRARRRKGRP